MFYRYIIYIYVCVIYDICIYMCIYKCICNDNSDLYTDIYIYIHICIDIYIYLYIYIHRHTYIYIYMRYIFCQLHDLTVHSDNL